MSAARNNANSKRNAAAEAASPDSESEATYASLPKRLTAWPRIFQPSGKVGLSSPSRWLEINSEDTGITSLNELRARAQDGSIPAIPIAKVGEALGGLTLTDKASDNVVLPNDPGSIRADAGLLRATVAVAGPSVVHVQTSVTLQLYADAPARGEAYRRILEQAAAAKAGEVCRVAWMTKDGKVRLVDYLASNGERIVPGAQDDLERLMGKEVHYTTDDLVADAVASLRAPRRPPAPQEPSTAKPSSSSAPRAGGAMFAVATQPDLFSASREAVAGGPRDPTAESHHIVVVVARLQDLNRKVVDGRALIHAGIVSNYGRMLTSGPGHMDASSRVFFAERTGESFAIVAMAPYVGLTQNLTAAHLIVHGGSVQPCQRLEFSLSQLGMNVPNLPFVVSKNCDLSGFHIPASARQQVWASIHTAHKWPTE